jgi:hypothetical protein
MDPIACPDVVGKDPLSLPLIEPGFMGRPLGSVLAVPTEVSCSKTVTYTRISDFILFTCISVSCSHSPVI